MAVIMDDHTAEIIAAKNSAINRALEAIGNQAVSHAKANITKAGRIDTGAMRNSMSHQVAADEEAVYVGTSNEYAIYHEYGTGIFADDGRGRQTPWAYQDAKGNWHTTRGMKPIHFLKDAIQNHTEEYKQIAKSFLQD